MMKMVKKQHPVDKPIIPQIDRFKEAARQLEADESEAAFDEKLRAIIKQKPKEETKRSNE
jgi:hypothetical protein